MNALIFVLFLILCWFQPGPDNQVYVNHLLKTPFKSGFSGFPILKGTAFDENSLSFWFPKNGIFGAFSSRTTIPLFLVCPSSKKQQTTFRNFA